MGSVVTNQLINNFYDLYRENEIVFTKDIMRSLHVDPRQVYIKCAGSQWPCIINSTSLTMAKIIVGTSGGAFKMISGKEVPPVSLRYCFVTPETGKVNFFVMGRVSDITPYMSSSELAVVTITFSSRPPDDLILRIGSLIDANESFTRRREERITITEAVQRKIGMEKRESIVSIDNVVRRCIIWDISFSGTQVIMCGDASYLKGRSITIRYVFSEPAETIDVTGIIVAVHDVEGKPQIVSVSIKFDSNTVPIAYKLRINDYLTYNRKQFLENNQTMAKNTDPFAMAAAANNKIVDQANQAAKAQEQKPADQNQTQSQAQNTQPADAQNAAPQQQPAPQTQQNQPAQEQSEQAVQEPAAASPAQGTESEQKNSEFHQDDKLEIKQDSSSLTSLY